MLNKVSNNKYDRTYFMIGTGHGNSYEGIGLRVQLIMKSTIFIIKLKHL